MDEDEFAVLADQAAAEQWGEGCGLCRDGGRPTDHGCDGRFLVRQVGTIRCPTIEDTQAGGVVGATPSRC